MKPVIRHAILSLLTAASASVWAADAPKAVPVTVAQTVIRALETQVSAPGELESLADPVIAAETDGRVTGVMVKEGEAVETGELLATLDPEPNEIALESAEANVARIEALIGNQQLIVKRLQDLMRLQSSAQSELDAARAELAASRAELTAARAGVRDARYRLARSEIKSPVGGVVQTRHISAGDYVKKGDPAFHIVAVDTLSARLFFPEAVAGSIRAGLPVELRAGGDRRVVKAQISRLLPVLDPTNRALSVMVEFKNAHGWRPGVSVTANVTTQTRERTVMAPVGSVVRRPAGAVVYRIEERRAVAQVVELGQRDGDWVEIVSGLAPGATVALDGAGFLTDGVPVEIRD